MINNPNYLFPQAENTACYTSKHIIEDGKPILHVVHDEDGEWQFMGDQECDVEDARIVTMGQIVQLDPSVNGLYEMPSGIGAFRESVGGEWKPYKLQ
ncbi:hypothetical protein [Persicirhabdus sediminis]|nr:hypothetical protein [Persicirhabdus sediminis]